MKEAKATKLLAMKRPALFPIIDERVVSLYKLAAAQKSGVPYPTMASIRDDVLDPSTGAALDTLRGALIANGTPKALRLAQLTNLRLRDVVLWQHWELAGRPLTEPAWPAKVAW